VRYAIFGDIHGNHQALEAVLEEMKKDGIEVKVCLGDIVGYGAEPSRCIATVRKTGCLTLAGNHDHAATGKLDVEYFNLYAREAALWTRKHLSDEERKWLDERTLIFHLNDVVLVHGSLHGPEQYHYIQSYLDAELSFEILDKSALFCAHTHVPVTFLDSTPMSHTLEPESEIPDKVKAIVNVGSVGQPRDEDPRAAYCLYDEEKRSVRIRRLEYDVETASRRILAAGLPEALAVRLGMGK